MSNAREKFQELLRELFQFDCADLDFGIYRIMNQKRAVIERFIEKDLLDAVGKELRKGNLREQGELTEQLDALAARIREDIADDAIDADGELSEEHAKTKLGKQYRELRSKAAGAMSSAELEAQVFNHLWAFFSRYYDNGDFLSLRRYSRREKYAIPYNGEEVYFHWANRDQYYIKTGETFTDYQWKAGDVSVVFKLLQAETEKDNVKSSTKRFFVPRLDAVAVAGNTVTLPFEYRGLTEQETIAFGKKNQQEAIITAAIESLPRRKALREASAALASVMAEYRKTGKGVSVSRMEHHLRRYTGKNTRDYFIHKDLKGFLTRELDFYLKNEVLVLDDLAAGGPERAGGWFQLMEAIRAVGSKIIAFVSQIEDFQKRVFEKRKFVTETNYCFTLDRVPKALWPKILKNKAQIEEWKKLYGIQDLKGYSTPLKQSFLTDWPSLMIDTAFFADDTKFIDTLLAGQKDVEESLGGLLVHSENFQALNLLLPRFTKRVKCIYIDPPYNTGSDGFVYKDSYQHSSWLSMLHGQLAVAKQLMSSSAGGCCNLNDIEDWRLRGLLTSSLGEDAYIATVTTKCSTASSFRTVNLGPVDVTDRLICFAKDRSAYRFTPQLIAKSVDLQHFSRFVVDPSRNPEHWEIRQIKLQVLRELGFTCDNTRAGMKLARDKWGDGADERVEDACAAFALSNAERVFETKTLQKPSKWLVEHIKRSLRDKDRIIELRRDDADPIYLLGGRQFYFLGRSVAEIGGERTVAEPASTLWLDIDTNNLKNEGGVDFPAGKKPLRLIRRVIGMSQKADGNHVLDFFAGSGSTGHAVVEENIEDGGDRRYLLVEMAAYFDSVLRVRLCRAVFARDWRNAKPVFPKNAKTAHLSHAFKYIRLESYEDALGNIAFDEPQGDLPFDDYVLRYMLGFETRKSETLLNVEKLAAPFAYQLDILEGGERKTTPVDLPETFNYLLGLKVSSRAIYVRVKKHRYLVVEGTTNPHGEGGERKVCVIWRDVTGWKAKDFKADAEFVKQEKLGAGADEVFVNADGVIAGARVLDPVFKERMFGPVVV
jgi:adenine-specific DNA-methyltransferase